MSQNVNAKQSWKVSSSVPFRHILHKNEKNNQSPHWWRDEGIPSSCPRFATSTPLRGLQILGTRMGFPRPSLNVVLDYFNLFCFSVGCLKWNTFFKIGYYTFAMFQDYDDRNDVEVKRRRSAEPSSSMYRSLIALYLISMKKTQCLSFYSQVLVLYMSI